MRASNLTEKDTGYFILLPADSGITDDLLQDLVPVKQDQSIDIFVSDWLIYKPAGEDDSYCWQIPGIKLYFKNETEIGKVSKIAHEIVSELSSRTQLSLELVFIDTSRLIEMGSQ